MTRQQLRWLVSYLLLIAAIFIYAPGCRSMPGLLASVDQAFGVLCETRSALVGAHQALDAGNIPLAIELTRQYLKDHGADDEVKAVLALLETQAHQPTPFDP